MFSLIRYWFDNLSDLLSGRIHNTIQRQSREIRVIDYANNDVLTYTNQVLQEIKTMTDNEQRILKAAAEVTAGSEAYMSNFQTVVSTVESLKSKFETLMAQAASPQAHEPEDLSQEFAVFDTAIADMQANIQQITAATGVATSATGGAGQSASLLPVDETNIGGPMEHAPIQETPLAGESGPTNVPTNPQTGEAQNLGDGEAAMNTTPQQPGTIQGNGVTDPELSASEMPSNEPGTQGIAEGEPGITEVPNDGSNATNSEAESVGGEQANPGELSSESEGLQPNPGVTDDPETSDEIGGGNVQIDPNTSESSPGTSNDFPTPSQSIEAELNAPGINEDQFPNR